MGGWGQADFNGDGVVDLGDFAFVSLNMGFVAESIEAQPNAVPEPGTGLLLVVFGGLITRRGSTHR